MAAILFLEYADDPKVNVLRVIKMLLVHDLVEIDAGNTYAYDGKPAWTKPSGSRRRQNGSSACCRPTRPPSSGGCGRN